MNTFLDQFLTQVKQHPDRPAIMDRFGADTYAAVNRRSALLAQALLEACPKGKAGARIALLLPRTRDYVTALLAVARAGCAAVPLDAEYPAERIQTVLEDAGCALCVTTEALAGKAGGFRTLIMETALSEAEKRGAGADESLNLSDPELEGLMI